MGQVRWCIPMAKISLLQAGCNNRYPTFCPVLWCSQRLWLISIKMLHAFASVSLEVYLSS